MTPRRKGVTIEWSLNTHGNDEVYLVADLWPGLYGLQRSIVKILRDTDSDGESDEEESGQNGADQSFDGNDDNPPQADKDQINLASLHSFDRGKYFTIAAETGKLLSEVRTTDNPSPSNTPTGVNFPVGFFEFKVSGLNSDGPTTVKIYLPPGSNIDTYYKFGSELGQNTPHWYEFKYQESSSARTGEKIWTGAKINGDIVTLHFVDGKRGDDDLTANGVISDIGAPGVYIPVRFSARAYFYPETQTYRASFSKDVTGPTSSSGWLKYYYNRTRMNFVSTGITAVSVSGNTVTISGTGTVNGVGGYTFTACVTNGPPDTFGVVIKKPAGTAYYSAGPKNISGGDLVIQ